ncbi:MAG: HIT family protein [Candidatus Komeilibacteria bacterium CG_4_10_14_0_2_um_filter_37_10]|uniref:HIT family protein n=1 Tax=Candidatus Komeilibacteria bacterium CG_4_10_14_0_2_um_filter_37_10 TaxID=1974470 RepID=A0A2M7VER1_9BACT|nr:MAG: HIT family protein [Candidatus Komeilibacteria bacterium CG_4_10_14_0_2_um_filter_37_10]
MNDCIFCQIIEGKIPSYKVYEDENYFAFLDIHPLNPGHVLLIPKKHTLWVDEVESFSEYWSVAHKISGAIKNALQPELTGYVTYGLGVNHAHIHIIPKYPGDTHDIGWRPDHVKEVAPEEMIIIAEKIIQQLK